MKTVLLSGSNLGTKTRTALNVAAAEVRRHDPEGEVTLLDLAELELQFSDGRNYLDYTGDAGRVARAMMDAEAIIIGTPIFHASIPAALKNVFDLLPQNAFRDKVIGIVATAGSSLHYLIAQTQLMPILAYMKAQIVQPYVFIEERHLEGGELRDADARLRLERLVEDTVVLTRTYRQIRQAQDDAYDF